jgi:hypothetical protein
LSNNPSNQRAKDNLSNAMSRLEQFVDKYGDIQMGSSGDNTIDISANIERLRRDQQEDLSQLSTE